MIQEGFENLRPENKLDTSNPEVPFVRFPAEVKKKMMEQGLTEDEITQREITAAAKIASGKKVA